MFEALGATIYRYRVDPGGHRAVPPRFPAHALARGTLTGGDIAGLEAGVADRHLDDVTGISTDTTLVAVFQSPELAADNPAALAAIDQTLEPLRRDPRVRSLVTPASAPALLASRMVNYERHAAYALISLGGTFQQALAAYPELRAAIPADRFTVTCTGRVAFLHDLDETLARDLLRAELISLPLALLILLLVFRTAVAALLPVAIGALSVLGGIAVVLQLSRYTDIAEYTINVCSLIGLGVAIDYSLFIVSRYREELQAHDYREALVRAVATAGRVVAFSGLAVGTGLAGLFFFRGSYLLAMGVGGAIVCWPSCLRSLFYPRCSPCSARESTPVGCRSAGWRRRTRPGRRSSARSCATRCGC